MNLGEAEKAIAAGAARALAFVFGVLLIGAACVDYAHDTIALFVGKDAPHEHHAAWLTAAFLAAGILLAFPSVAQVLYQWAKPLIPSLSFGKKEG